MRSFAFISMLLAVTQVVFAAPAQTTPTSSIEARAGAVPENSELYGSNFQHAPRKARNVLSNAERFARGLPPAPLKQKLGVARRAGASATPQITKRGIIQVFNSANNAVIGYISKSSINGAQYRYQSEANALIVTFKIDSGATSVSTADLIAENGDTGYPHTGLVQGRDNVNSNLGSGSFHYAYIGGSSQTAAGATPSNVANSYTSSTGVSRTAESAVWNIDLTTGEVTPQWVNTDGTKPTVSIFSQSTALFVSGDPGAYAARFPAPITRVYFKFLERP